VRTLRSGDELTIGMAVSPDGHWLATTSRQGAVRWSLAAGGLPAEAHGPRGLGAWLSAATTATLGDGERFASSAATRTP